jgi:DNA-binding GntR family transcriptional regulator
VVQLEAVGPGETLARQALPVLRAAILEGRHPPGGEVVSSRQLGIGRAPRRGAPRHPIEEGPIERVSLAAMAGRGVDRAEARLRQHIARNVARLAATEASG